MLITAPLLFPKASVQVEWFTPAINEPVWDDHKGRRQYALTEDQEIWIIKDHQRYIIRVLKDYIYNGASVPAIATLIAKVFKGWDLDSDGILRNPSPLHDRGYELDGHFRLSSKFIKVFTDNDRQVQLDLTRKELDQIYAQMLWITNYILVNDPRNTNRNEAAGRKEVMMVYHMLHWFGGIVWKQ